MELEKLKYPIGRYQQPEIVTAAMREKWIDEIAALPYRLEAVVIVWTDEQLDTPYRPGGWTVRQLVHHIADSHMNAHCRTRLALTEDKPTIKPYDQDEWVKLADVQRLRITFSLDIIRGLHARWAFLLKQLNETEWQRQFVHPEYGNTYSVESVCGLYAWHGNHHLAHITALKERSEWG